MSDEQQPIEEFQRVEFDPELIAKARDAVERVNREEQQRMTTAPGEGVNQFFAAAMKRTGLSKEELLALQADVEIPPLRVDVLSQPERMRMKRAHVPKRHADHLVESPRDLKALEIVKEFIDHKTQWVLVLSGGVGIGKSGSACWALGQHDGGMFFKASKLLNYAFEQKDVLERIASASVVVCDDFGTKCQDEKGFFLEKFNDLVDDLYGNGAKLIITCNLAKETFAKLAGERVIDRIREQGRFVMLEGESIRREI